jgi:prepilin-type N-terminal cleavage/methylation domain-containing protein
MRFMTVQRQVGAAGFTLLELIIALALAGAVGLVAAPQISHMRAQYELATAANTLAFEITRTRMQAVGQNNYMRVRASSNSQYVREKSDNGTTYTQDGTATTLPSNVTVSAGTTGSPTFNRSGIATSSTAFTLSRTVGNRTMHKTVTTSILGRVSIS